MAPKEKKKRKQYTCQCHCGCRRSPGRLVICDWCGQGVGPGCCTFHEDALRAYCHYCRAPPPEHNGLQPEHNGLQSEHNRHGSQPDTAIIHCNTGYHRAPLVYHSLPFEHRDAFEHRYAATPVRVTSRTTLVEADMVALLGSLYSGQRRCLGRTESCPADMSPAGSVRFDAVLQAYRDGREVITW